MEDCNNCPMPLGTCTTNLAEYALDIIKRQQAKIEGLTYNAGLREKRKQALKAEAIKEFVKAIEARLENNWNTDWEVFHSVMGSIQELAASRGVE